MWGIPTETGISMHPNGGPSVLSSFDITSNPGVQPTGTQLAF